MATNWQWTFIVALFMVDRSGCCTDVSKPGPITDAGGVPTSGLSTTGAQRPPRPWSQCFRLASNITPLADPHGQGRELLGFGIQLAGFGTQDPTASYAGTKLFARIDRFDPRSVTTKDGLLVEEFSIDGTTINGYVRHDGTRRAVEDWQGTTFIGRMRCPNPDLNGAELSVEVRLLTMSQMKAIDVASGPETSALVQTPVYTFELVNNATGIALPQRNLCRDHEVAIPVPGYFDAAANYRADPEDANRFETGRTRIL